MLCSGQSLGAECVMRVEKTLPQSHHSPESPVVLTQSNVYLCFEGNNVLRTYPVYCLLLPLQMDLSFQSYSWVCRIYQFPSFVTIRRSYLIFKVYYVPNVKAN